MVTICIIALVVLFVLALAARRFLGTNDTTPASDSCATCTSAGSKCARECMIEAAAKPTEYYDDEDLDTYRGRPSDAYTDTEAEEFRYVLYTMRPDEAEGWSRSLAARGINVPDQLKDELLLLLGDTQGHA